MEKILISACLIGEVVRYNGKNICHAHPILKKWECEGRLVSLCPEIMASLPLYRPPAEIIAGDGDSVLSGLSQISTVNGLDVTDKYILGAYETLRITQRYNIKIAILKDNSPSCGGRFIYDGTFSGTKKAGKGVTAELLEQNGIRVFNEEEISAAAKYLSRIANERIQDYSI